MTEPSPSHQPTQDSDAMSLEGFGITLLRSRKQFIGWFAVSGLAVGITLGLLSHRVYLSSAIFIPLSSEVGMSGLAIAASQLGIQVPSSNNAWGPPIYLELLQSRSLLEPLARDTLVVAEDGGRRVALVDLLDIPPLQDAERTDRAVRALRMIAAASENKRLNGVTLVVTTRWPSVSLAVAETLLRGVNQFNLETRQSQGAAERRFVEVQAGEAERALREAEDRLQTFLQRNRSVANSPKLTFAEERLRRAISLHQTVYTSLMEAREQARIREVRDTPVITVLEMPRLASRAESRRIPMKGVLGAFAGMLVGLLMSFIAEGLARIRRGEAMVWAPLFRILAELTMPVRRRASR